MSVSRVIAVITGVFLLGALAVAQRQNSGLRADAADLNARLGQVIAAGAAREAALETMRNQKARDDAALSEAAAEAAKQAERARYLDGRLRRAIHDQKAVSPALPRAVTDALCLRYLAAEGRLPGDYAHSRPGDASSGRDDSVAAFCAAWDGAAPEDILIWSGQLVDQVGRFKARAAAARGLRTGNP